jgi:hemerythrin-like domain-containing protein/beta-phosphoglucomutase-like phosphatase (HAD superfamily)
MKIKIAFLDIRDTLGYVDRPGHLVLFKPTTLQLLKSLKDEIGLRIGIITNLPENVSHEEGVKMLDEAKLLDYVDREDIISNHLAKEAKPKAAIFEYACAKLGVDVSEALFIGENLLEIIGANAAGLHSVLKPFPPRRDFIFKPVSHEPGSATNSGRLSEVMIEEEHIIGKRIVAASAKIVNLITENEKVPMVALGNLVYLFNNFVDPYHNRKEENILIPFAISRGYPIEKTRWIIMEHEQGRAYFKSINLAYERIQNGFDIAYFDLRLCLEGVIKLYKQHGDKEDNEFLPEMCSLLSEADDALIVDLLGRAGPDDLTPYLTLLSQIELELIK